MNGSEGRALTANTELLGKRSSVLWNTLGVAASLLFLMLVTAGCSTIVDKGEEVDVTLEQYRTFWPLTVDSGTLVCLNPTGRRKGEAIFRAPDGTTYALNDTATEAGHADLDTISRDHPTAEGYKMNPFRFEELALEECF